MEAFPTSYWHRHTRGNAVRSVPPFSLRAQVFAFEGGASGTQACVLDQAKPESANNTVQSDTNPVGVSARAPRKRNQAGRVRTPEQREKNNERTRIMHAWKRAVRQATRIVDGLRARGLPGAAEVTVAVEVSKPGERRFTCTLDRLAESLAAQAVTGVAVLLITWPKVAASEVALSA